MTSKQKKRIKSLEGGIGSYKARLQNTDRLIHEAVNEGRYTTAARLVAEAKGFQNAIKELEFQLDLAEYEAKLDE